MATSQTMTPLRRKFLSAAMRNGGRMVWPHKSKELFAMGQALKADHGKMFLKLGWIVQVESPKVPGLLPYLYVVSNEGQAALKEVS